MLNHPRFGADPQFFTSFEVNQLMKLQFEKVGKSEIKLQVSKKNCSVPEDTYLFVEAAYSWISNASQENVPHPNAIFQDVNRV